MLHSIEHKPELYSYITNDLPKMVPIAPAPLKQYSPLEIMDKRKYTSKSNPYTGQQAASIARRNARERNRVKQVNDGFNALRKRLPSAVVAALSGGSRRGSGKKLSKVDTLKMVVEYIRYLQRMIEDSDAALGITSQNTQMEHYESEDKLYGGCGSPYSDSVPSPSASECSSGVSSAYSSIGCLQNYSVSEQHLTRMEEDDLLDAISWWQEK